MFGLSETNTSHSREWEWAAPVVHALAWLHYNYLVFSNFKLKKNFKNRLLKFRKFCFIYLTVIHFQVTTSEHDCRFSNSRMWSPARVQPPSRPPHAQIENEDDQFLQV